MGQLSFFSADFAPPQVSDLGGLLAAHGQIVVTPGGARLSILLPEHWRAEALATECAGRGVKAKVVKVDGPAPFLLRTDKDPQLVALAAAWTKGAVKSVPESLGTDPGFLRCWAISAGKIDPPGYLLGMDPHAPDTHEALASVCARAGLAGSLIGVRGGGPGIRIVGHRRLTRLVEFLGQTPEGGPEGSFPESDY